MKPVDQTVLASDRPGHGNCLAACVASITELPLDELTAALDKDAAAEGEHWMEQLIRVMSVRGFAVDWSSEQTFAGHVITCGKGPRGTYHAVVTLDGEIVHDPHASRAGLETHESYISIQPAEVPSVR